MGSNELSITDELILRAKDHLSIIKENQKKPMRYSWVGESFYTEVPFKSSFDI